MLKPKSLMVTGETVYRDGKPFKNISAKVDAALLDVFKNIDAENLVDIKINTNFGGLSGDSAFILILYTDNKTDKTDDKKAKK